MLDAKNICPQNAVAEDRLQRFEDYLLVRAFGNPNSTKYNLFVFLRRDIAERNGFRNLDEIWKPADELRS